MTSVAVIIPCSSASGVYKNVRSYVILSGLLRRRVDLCGIGMGQFGVGDIGLGINAGELHDLQIFQCHQMVQM